MFPLFPQDEALAMYWDCLAVMAGACCDMDVVEVRIHELEDSAGGGLWKPCPVDNDMTVEDWRAFGKWLVERQLSELKMDKVKEKLELLQKMRMARWHLEGAPPHRIAPQSRMLLILFYEACLVNLSLSFHRE